MTRPTFLSIAAFLLISFLSACNLDTPNITPTPEVLITETPTQVVSPTLTASPTASATATEDIIEVPVIVATPLPLQPDAPIVDTIPTETPAPCPATIRSGETLSNAVFRVSCGNSQTFDLIDAVVAFNDNIINPDIVSEGLEFLVPRPSATPIPQGLEMTQTVAAQTGIDSLGGVGFVQGTQFDCHTIEEGENAIGIAERYNSTLEQLAQLNQNIVWSGCNFTNPSGGPGCSPFLVTGTCMTVPLPTGTPVPTSTPSGNETATPTPTARAARAVFPPQGALASAGRVELQWVGVSGALRPNEIYLIEFADRTANVVENFVSDSNNFELPDRLIPTSGQAHQIEWRVIVAAQNTDGSYTPSGGTGNWNRFQWNSR